MLIGGGRGDEGQFAVEQNVWASSYYDLLLRKGEGTVDISSASSLASHSLGDLHKFSFIHGKADRTLSFDKEERSSNSDTESSDEKHALRVRRSSFRFWPHTWGLLA